VQALDPAKLQLFLLFAVPGIIALFVRAQFLTGRMPPAADGILAYVTVSLVYHALAFPLAPKVYGASPLNGSWSWTWPLFVFVIPTILGVLLGLSAQHGWMSRLLTKLRLMTTHPIGCAWDWKFGGISECWVLVILKNGIRWGGRLGDRSFISSVPTERDIFLQQVYEVDDEGKWTPRTSGVWIAHGEIQSVEFWPMMMEEANGKQQ
jgi:hypothetical protein